MSYFLAVFLTLFQTAPSLNDLIAGVERTFARMRDFSADFVQNEQNSLNQRTLASGHLYMARPRKTRWEYKRPEEQLFVSDGKVLFMYIPADKQARRGDVKDTVDDRIPLMFLVGQTKLRGEFEKFALLPQKPEIAGAVVIQMFPKRKSDLSELVMEVDPKTFLIRRLVMKHSDGQTRDFQFSNIKTDSTLPDSLFKFTPPPGVRVLEGIGR